MREDKDAKSVIKETETPIEIVSQKIERPKPSISITHPDKILYSEDKITKADVFTYYSEIVDFILPYISNRPLTLLRCPGDYK